MKNMLILNWIRVRAKDCEQNSKHNCNYVSYVAVSERTMDYNLFFIECNPPKDQNCHIIRMKMKL